MDFTLPPETVMLQDMLRHFVEKDVRPLEGKYFLNGRLEPSDRARLQGQIEKMGLWGAALPASLNGGELDLLTTCILEEELGKTHIPLDIGNIPPMLLDCEGVQISRYLQPVLGGERQVFLAAYEAGTESPKDWKSTSIRSNGGYLLNGNKLLGGVPQPDDFMVFFARTDLGISAFLVDASLEGLSFQKGPVPQLFINDCFVDQGALLGREGNALDLGKNEGPRMWVRTGARFVGYVGRLVEMSAIYASNWVSFGRPLADRPAVRRLLAEIQVQLECCRLLVLRAAWLGDQNKPLECSSAQVRFATAELLSNATNFATMIFGGPGPLPQFPIHRFVQGPLSKDLMKANLETASVLIVSQMLAPYQRSDT